MSAAKYDEGETEDKWKQWKSKKAKKGLSL